MRRFTEPAVLARLVIPLIVLALLGVTPQPHVVTQALRLAGLAMKRDASPAAAARAAQALAQTADQLPWRTDLWEVAGRLALKGEDLPSAIRFFERASQLGSLSPEGRLALGDAYDRTGDLPAAIQAWEGALQAGASPFDAHARLLRAHRSQDDYPGAIRDLQALTALQPADAALRYQLGLLLATQQPSEALAHLAQAAELDPSLEAKTQVIIQNIRTGSLAGDPPQTLFEAGRALATLGEWQLAAEAFHQAALARPDFADAWAFWGEARQHLQESFFGQPLPPELERALSLDPDSLSANTLVSLYWRRQGNFDRALEYMNKAASLYPQNPSLQVELGDLLALSGDLQGGLQAYLKAVELAPNDPLYLRQLAGFCIRNEFQMQDTGLPAARQAVALDLEDPQNLDVLGQALFILGDLDSAGREFQRALEIDPRHLAAHLHLGLVYILQDERSLALQQWKTVLTLAPGTPEAEQAERLIKNYFP